MFRGGSPESKDPFAGTPSCPNRPKSWWSWCGAPRAVPVSLTPSSAAGRKVPGLGSHFQRRLLGSESGRDAARAPRTLSQFPRPAQKLHFLEAPAALEGEVERENGYLKARSARAAPWTALRWRGERGAAGLQRHRGARRQIPEKCCGRLSRWRLARLHVIGVGSGFKGREVHCTVKWLIPRAVVLFVF